MLSATELSPVPVSPTVPDLGAALRGREELTPMERRTLVLAVTAAHVLAACGLLQLDSVRQAMRDVAPLMVDLVAPTTPDPPKPTLPPRPRVTLTRPTAPLIPTPAPVPATESFITPPPESEPEVAAPSPVPTPQAPPAPPPAPLRKVVAATAVQYLVLPPVEVPRLSRRAGEAGTVWLRVVVDVRGHPLLVSVQRSSGFVRLDEQAVWAMRQARFKPHTENGQPIELEVTAPVEYTLE